MNLASRALSKLLHRPLSPLDYWHDRVQSHGPKSVINLAHQDMDEITRMQEREIFPHLRAQLRGDERTALDFGCGVGRFSAKLAQAIGGIVIGVDPMQKLLDQAPQSPSVSYLRLRGHQIPLAAQSVDLIWSCLVMGAVNPPEPTIQEMRRVLKPNGLVFLIENTADKPSSPYWTFRSVETYVSLFRFANMRHLGDYFDVGERISIMAGRVS